LPCVPKFRFLNKNVDILIFVAKLGLTDKNLDFYLPKLRKKYVLYSRNYSREIFLKIFFAKFEKNFDFKIVTFCYIFIFVMNFVDCSRFSNKEALRMENKKM